MPLSQIFLSVALFNGLVLITALLARKNNHVPNLFLSGTIATGLYFQFIIYLKTTGYIDESSALRRSSFPASLLSITLLCLYVLSLTTPDFRLNRRLLVHALPFAFGLLWYAVHFLLPTDVFWKSDPKGIMHERYLRAVIGCAISGAYLYAGYRQLRRYRDYIRVYFSDLRGIRLAWLQWLLALFVPSWLVVVAEVLTGPYISMERYMIVAITLTMLLIGLFGLRQSTVFSSDVSWAEQHPAVRDIAEARRAAEPIFSEDELSQWKKRLDNLMEREKLYLNPELRLFDLAQSLDLKSYQASELINRATGSNFYEYVNGHRVEEAKRRLVDPAYVHLNILGISTDCGFRSKSVFNDAFRKATGLTPSAFRDQASIKAEKSA